jgi:hypothetical protein
MQEEEITRALHEINWDTLYDRNYYPIFISYTRIPFSSLVHKEVTISIENRKKGIFRKVAGFFAGFSQNELYLRDSDDGFARTLTGISLLNRLFGSVRVFKRKNISSITSHIDGVYYVIQ